VYFSYQPAVQPLAFQGGCNANLDWVALNPQPLPPRSAFGSRAIIVIGG
jgi:hypothetical protein